ncbi:MAG TPA: hypothetical protein VMT18_09575 [Planctomycetota bacterium]|nr:hypothetical protein [Planctomycetota bacterium]
MAEPNEPNEPDDATEPTFGARFLEEWKRLGGPLSNWSYAEIQELRTLEREAMVAAVARRHPLTPRAVLLRIRTAESPELLAREVLHQSQLAAQTSLWLILSLLP